MVAFSYHFNIATVSIQETMSHSLEYLQMNTLFYTPKLSSAFSTLAKFKHVVKDKPNVYNWLLKQDAYTLH